MKVGDEVAFPMPRLEVERVGAIAARTAHLFAFEVVIATATKQKVRAAVTLQYVIAVRPNLKLEIRHDALRASAFSLILPIDPGIGHFNTPRPLIVA